MHWSYNNIVFWAACLFGFFGFLRPNNFLIKGHFDAQRHIQRQDIVEQPDGFLVNIKITKTMQFRSKPIHIYMPKISGHPLDPHAAISLLLSSSALPSSPLFSLEDGSILTYGKFLKALRFLLTKIGLPSQQYGGHSFRRGAATWANQTGLSNQQIQMLGFWSSSCYQRYIDTDGVLRLQALSKFSSNLPS